MADYYLEPGLYTYAATPTWGTAQEGDGCNGSGANLTAVLTGDAVTSITITNGGTGYSTNTRVYLVGGGGSGAVATVASVNNDGAITGFTISNGGSGYTTAPTVSLVPGAAIPATGKIVISAVPTSGTISVCGASVSTTGVIGAANEDAAANTLASNINATTNTVNSGTAPSTPPLRNAVFARGPSGGAPSGTCEIMTRAGSRLHNQDINSSCAIASTLNNATVTQFGASGMQRGFSGCWGWLFNDDAAIWPSNVAIRTYGAIRTAAGQAPIAGPAPTISDVVHIRANNFTYTVAYSVSPTIAEVLRITTFLVDDGTIWRGDTGTLTINIRPGVGSSQNTGFFIGYSVSGMNGPILAARTLGRLIIKSSHGGSGSYALMGSNSFAKGTFHRVYWLHSSEGSNASIPRIWGTSGSGSTFAAFDCRYKSEVNQWLTLFSFTNSGNCGLTLRGCTFEWTNLSSAPSSALIDTLNQNAHQQFIDVSDITAICPTGDVNPFSASYPADYSNISGRVLFRNLHGFSLPSSAIGLAGRSNVYISTAEMLTVMMMGIGPKRALRVESNIGNLDWIPDQNFPTLDSTLPDGTPWSYRYLWPWTVDKIAVHPGLQPTIINLTKTNILSSGQLHVDLELFVHDGFDHLFTDDLIGITVTYVAAVDDKVRRETTLRPYLAPTGVALQSSSAAWSGGAWAGTHVARKIRLTTSQAVKQATEIEVSLVVGGEAPTSTQTVFINPEVALTAV